MEKAIIKLFNDHKGKVLGMQDIYHIFQSYYPLSDFQRELDPKYPRPRFHHEIRSIIAKLVNEGIIERLRRNCYIKT